MKRLYAEIAKTEAQEDGTIKVFGYASSGVEDSDGEIITPDAMKAALPNYMKFGAVREMHDSKKAAGTALEANVQEDGRTWFGAHVVDPIAVKKVSTGVYKGFSIGGKVVERDDLNKRLIKGINLVEVSLVDRPANPEAVFTMFKAETVDGQPGDEGEAAEKNDDVGTGDVVQKGMWNASRLLEALSTVKTACEDAEFEQKRGEHSEQLIDAMKSVRQSLAAVLVNYIGEEISPPGTTEKMAKAGFTITENGVETYWQAPDGVSTNEVDIFAKSVFSLPSAEMSKRLTDAGYEPSTIIKAGARYSKATKTMLKAAHDACKAADKALGDLKYDEGEDADDDEQAKAEAIPASGAHGALLKACGAAGCPDGEIASEWITKMAGEMSELRELAKAAGVDGDSPAALVNALVKRTQEVAGEIEKLKDQPAPPKGYANGVALSKADDRAGGETKEVAPVVTSSGEENEVATMIKAAQAKPIRFA